MKYIKIITAVLLLVILSGCSYNINESSTTDSNPGIKPELTEIRSICNLATLECYYHNVAISNKPAGTGLKSFLETDRTFWIEYSGIVRSGVDLSELEMRVDGNKIIVTIPPATVLGIKVDESSLDENSIIVSKDAFLNKNPIEAEDQTAAIKAAQATMLSSAQENTTLLLSAQSRAKELIEVYINQISEYSGIPYEIVWEYES